MLMDKNTTNLTEDVQDSHLAVLRLLAYSWQDIDFQYSGLTKAEKQLITEKQFQFMVHQMKANHIIP